jgi:hypothetical protein
MAFSAIVNTGPRRENALRDDLKPEGPVQLEQGGLQETQTYRP